MVAYNWDVVTTPSRFIVGAPAIMQARYSFTSAVPFVATDTLGAIATTGTRPLVLPKNAIVTDVYVDAPEVDTNAAPTGTVSVGYTGATAAFISAGALGAASSPPVALSINVAPTLSGNVIATGRGTQLTADTAIFITFGANVATQAASGLITLTIKYHNLGY